MSAAHVIILLGVTLLAVAALGVWRLPDALARQHAATKAGTLGVTTILLGAAAWSGQTGWFMRALGAIAILFVTLPVASHVLARAIVRENGLEDEMARAPLFDQDAGK